jgi:hypothetical protein
LESLTILAESVNWHQDVEELRLKPAVVPNISDRAKVQDFERDVDRYLKHLQYVCQKPRLHLRVEQERLPVSRARRVPVRAVAELVSRPGDWESRSFSSVRPKQILTRVSEDEWNLYENRVAVRLVDHLLEYFGLRVEELTSIDCTLQEANKHSDEAKSWYMRAHRVFQILADSIENGVEDTLQETLRFVNRIYRQLQALLDSPLYKEIPRGSSVPTALKSTNILVNDKNYRRVAHLWREWVKHGHLREKTKEELIRQRQEHGKAWDGFIYHLVLRAFSNNLEAELTLIEGRIEVSRKGYLSLELMRDSMGVINLRQGDDWLRLLPICADFKDLALDTTLVALEQFANPESEIVVMHNGSFEVTANTPTADVLRSVDRLNGWSFNGRPTLFGCSPWSIDSEERLARLLNGWMNRVALPEYPLVRKFHKLPDFPKELDWMERRGDHVVVLKMPRPDEMITLKDWTEKEKNRLKVEESHAKVAKLQFERAPLNALRELDMLLDEVEPNLAHLSSCPVCPSEGKLVPRPGQKEDGSESTWWAECKCGAEWGLRLCKCCNRKFRVLIPDKKHYATENKRWPDDIYGRDVWAQPCQDKPGQYRCAHCGSCPGGQCDRCGLGQLPGNE